MSAAAAAASASQHLPVWLDAHLEAAAGTIGVPQDQLRLLGCLLLAIPLGFVHKSLPTPTIKHWYSFLTGFFVAWFTVGNGALHMLLASLVVYASATVTSRSAYTPHVVSALLMVYLSYFHIYRMVTDYLGWTNDVSLILMVFVVKASTFSYNCADGARLARGERLHAKTHIHEHRAQRALVQVPSLIEFLSYIWFFGGVLVGPCYEAREYLEFTNLALFRAHKLDGVPSTWFPTLIAFGRALMCYPFILIQGGYPISGYTETPAFAALPQFVRFQYFWVTITCVRFKYYFAWYLSESGCNASGLGFSGVKRAGAADAITAYEFERCRNANALSVELSSSMPQMTNNWNMGTNNWLKNYVYLRVDAPSWVTRVVSQKQLANIVTKFTSAFWHGFYGAYYLFFLGAFFVNEMDDTLRTHLEPRFSRIEEVVVDGKPVRKMHPLYPHKYVYNVISWTLVYGCMNYLGMAFQLLDPWYSLQFWGSLYYYGLWLPIVVILLCKVLLPVRRSKKPATTATAAAEAAAAPADADTKKAQ